jgi:23S rRNA pseudouridine2605 synthase
MSPTRLNKYIASSGICSRRKADELIESGAVVVNNKKVTELGFIVRDKDKVFINNKLIHPVKHQYYRFFKPAGYITTSDDEKGRKTIYDLIPKELWGLKPVGRLDKDSTGLLILTNDGDLINELTHPSVKVPKVYIVSVDSLVAPHELEKMANGIEIEKGKIAYADIEVLEVDKDRTMMRITLYQGMNRQIRKMFEALGYKVTSLKRIQHATLTLEGLKRGEFKPIKPGQIKDLKNFLNRIVNKND